MKLLILLLLILNLCCNDNSKEREKEQKNELNCLLLSITFASQSLSKQNTADQLTRQEAEKFFNTALTTTIFCQGYLEEQEQKNKEWYER
jgi:hypothetical protein